MKTKKKSKKKAVKLLRDKKDSMKKKKKNTSSDKPLKKKKKKSGGGFMSPDQLNKQISRNKKKREQAEKTRVPTFWMKDGEIKYIRFLHDEPVCMNVHTLRQGKYFADYTCRALVDEDGCPLCEAGYNASGKAVYNIIDRTEYKDRKGKMHKNEVKLLKAGTRIFNQIEKKKEKYGLLKSDYEISRTGAGTATTYNLEKEQKSKLSKRDKHAELIDIEDKLMWLSYDDMNELVEEVGEKEDD